MGTWSDILDASVAGTEDAPFVAALRLPTLDGWERGRVWTSWPVEREFLTPAVACLFGGYIAGLADHLLGLAVFTVLRDDEAFATTDLQVHFLRPVRDGVLGIVATVISRGRSSAYCEVSITDANGVLVARAAATQSIRSV